MLTMTSNLLFYRGSSFRKNVVCICVPITTLILFQFLLLSQQPADLKGNDTWEGTHIRDAFVTRQNRTVLSDAAGLQLSASIEGKPFVTSVKRSGPIIRGVKKERLNFSCSFPYTLAPQAKPTPFDDLPLLRNATHVTCSMGCTNATFPINIPSFLIIGAQKGGTTALYHYFSSHPMVLPSIVFEPHFFDSKSKYKPYHYGPERLCHMRQVYIDRNFNTTEYLLKAAELYPNPLLTFEKTPAYIRNPGTAFKVFLTYPNIKLVAILRSPVTRSHSEYSMEYFRAGGRTRKLADSYDVMVQKSVESLRAAHLSVAPTLDEYRQNPRPEAWDFSLPNMTFTDALGIVERSLTWHSVKKKRKMLHNTLYSGMYALHLSQWLEYFELGKSLMVVQFEKLLANKTLVFGEICDFLGLPRIDLSDAILDQDYRPVQSNSTKNGTVLQPVDPLLNETREYLEHFYRPYNEALARMLGNEWRSVWYD